MKTKDIAKQYGVKAKGYACDVTDPEKVTQTVAAFVKDFGPIHGLLNNAGICEHKPAVDVTYEGWLHVMDVNVNGIFLMAQAVARQMIKDEVKGSIVNTSSGAAHGIPHVHPQIAYNTSKSAITNITKSFALELAPYGIRVNAISPGFTMTELTREDIENGTGEEWKAGIPLGRVGLPEDMAGAFIYFMSEASSYVTGSDLIIDGGGCI